MLDILFLRKVDKGIAADTLRPDRKYVNIHYKRHDYLTRVELFSIYLL